MGEWASGRVGETANETYGTNETYERLRDDADTPIRRIRASTPLRTFSVRPLPLHRKDTVVPLSIRSRTQKTPLKRPEIAH